MTALRRFRGPRRELPRLGLGARVPPARRCALRRVAARAAAGVFLVLASLAGGCLPEVSARARPGPEGVLRLRNRTDEPVCYVHIDPAGVSRDASESEDRLLPSEVVLPGEERDFEVTRGGFRVRLLDCARRVLWANALLEIDDGVILELWLRRGGERSR